MLNLLSKEYANYMFCVFLSLPLLGFPLVDLVPGTTGRRPAAVALVVVVDAAALAPEVTEEEEGVVEVSARPSLEPF